MEFGKKIEVKAPLEVDASRGEFNQFHIAGRQILFQPSLFQNPRLMTKEGRDFFKKVYKLGGKGVIVTGEEFSKSVRFTQDLTLPQTCLMIEDIKACPEVDPMLCPELEAWYEDRKDANETAVAVK